MNAITPDFGGRIELFRHETSEQTPKGLVKGQDAITLSILPPYASADEEAEYIQLSMPEAVELAEYLLHLTRHEEETLPETDSNGIPLFINPIEKSLYE